MAFVVALPESRRLWILGYETIPLTMLQMRSGFSMLDAHFVSADLPLEGGLGCIYLHCTNGLSNRVACLEPHKDPCACMQHSSFNYPLFIAKMILSVAIIARVVVAVAVAVATAVAVTVVVVVVFSNKQI